MNYLLQCQRCRATTWVSAMEDWETNSAEYDLDNAEWEWENDPTAEELLCDHEDFDVVDSEFQYEDPHWYT